MKYWNYVIISVGLALLFELAGIPLASSILGYVGINLTTGFSLKTAGLYLAILGGGGILIGLGTGIAIGFLTKSQPENFVILPFIIGGATIFFSVWTAIVTYAFANFASWIAYITLFISGLLGTGFVISAYEHFRGTD